MSHPKVPLVGHGAVGECKGCQGLNLFTLQSGQENSPEPVTGLTGEADDNALPTDNGLFI